MSACSPELPLLNTTRTPNMILLLLIIASVNGYLPPTREKEVPLLKSGVQASMIEHFKDSEVLFDPNELEDDEDYYDDLDTDYFGKNGKNPTPKEVSNGGKGILKPAEPTKKPFIFFGRDDGKDTTGFAFNHGTEVPKSDEEIPISYPEVKIPFDERIPFIFGMMPKYSLKKTSLLDFVFPREAYYKPIVLQLPMIDGIDIGGKVAKSMYDIKSLSENNGYTPNRVTNAFLHPIRAVRKPINSHSSYGNDSDAQSKKKIKFNSSSEKNESVK